MYTVGRPHWISFHCHFQAAGSSDLYGPACDRVITCFVGPLAREMIGRGLAKRYFFVRYNEGGTHIRLRLECPSPDAEHEIRRAVEGWLPTDDGETPTVRPAAYEPEYDRYGGEEAVRLAERIFHSTSDIALDILSVGLLTASKRLGRALILDMVLAHAFIARQPEYGTFFREYGNRIRSRLAGSAESGLQRRFERGLGGQRTRVAPYILETWDRLTTGGVLSEPLDNLHREMDEQQRRLAALARQGRVRSGRQTPGTVLPVSAYLHMANNRIGVSPADEAYVAFLISKVLAPCV